MTPTQQVTSVEPPTGAPERPSAARPRRRPVRLLSMLAPRRISAVYLLGLFVLLFGLLQPDTFLTDVTFTLIFRSGVVTCILALAFLVPLTAGAYDLSIGSVMALSLGLVIYLSIHTDLPDTRDGPDRDRGGRLLRRRLRVHRGEAARQLVHRDARRQPGARGRGAAAVEQHPAHRRSPGLLVHPRQHEPDGHPQGRLHAAAPGAGDVVRPRVHPHRALPAGHRWQHRGLPAGRRADRPGALRASSW